MDRSWFPPLAELISDQPAADTANALADLIALAVSHEGTCLIAFHAQRTPDVLHHTLEPAGVSHYLDRYLAGPYLLDPLFRLSQQTLKPGVCRYRDATPDRFRASEYYRQYCEQTHLTDEIDYLVDVAGGTTLALVVGRRKRRFSQVEVARLHDMADLVHAAMRKVWDRRENGSAARPDAEAVQLTRCFDNFGAGLLTDRERQITQLLLQGHSTKSVARELGIAPGTVMVHKRNLFSKLAITSQYELFSRFIEELTH
ncbi:MAG: helix-turn-helix transcriptional regulator [Pseudomonadota bacterium]